MYDKRKSMGMNDILLEFVYVERKICSGKLVLLLPFVRSESNVNMLLLASGYNKSGWLKELISGAVLRL